MSKRIVWLVYSSVALLILLPLFLPGYILTLDLVFTPHIPWPTQLSNTSVFEALLHVANIIIPSQVIEKLLLFAIFVLSGVGAHRLMQLVAKPMNHNYVFWGAYAAGLLYMINPFVYSRFMAGQYLVLLGYALTPFLVAATIRLIQQPSWQRSLVAAAWATAIAGVSIHHIGIVLVMTVATATALGWHYRQQTAHLKKAAIFCLLAIGTTLLVNSFWLIPTALGKTDISQAASSFGNEAFDAFATNSSGALGAFGNVMRLQGFWADSRDMYTLPQQQVPAWGVWVLILWVVVIIGALILWRHSKALTVALTASAIPIVVITTTPVISILSHTLPFIGGYREPEKFVGLLALVFALFAGIGVAGVIAYLNKRDERLASATLGGLLALPLVITPTIIWGANGQLQPRDYPKDWYTVNDQLHSDPSVKKVLFLPWHQYINFGFSDRIIANPALKFFDAPMVAGDNPEYKNLQPTVPNAFNRQVESQIVNAHTRASDIGKQLASLGFTHVLLAKEYDYANYDYLDHQHKLTLQSDTSTLKLYKVTP